MQAGSYLRWVARLVLVPGLALGVVGCDAASDGDPAEDVPAADVFVADLSVDGPRVTLRPPQNITMRADGYDNQPHFTPDGRGLLYTSVRDDRADVYRFDLIFRNIEPVAQTETSEFSPTPMPGTPERLSVVRVEADGTQRLWAFDRDGTNEPDVLLPDIEPVGYHAWIDDTHVALFVLGDPPTLQVANVETGAVETVAEDIGPSLQSVPDAAAVSFVQNREEDAPQIRQFDRDTETVETLIEVVDGPDDDHAWTPEGVLLSVSGSMLYKWAPDHDVSWEPVVEVPNVEFTRLAVAPDGERLALVVEEPDEDDEPDAMELDEP